MGPSVYTVLTSKNFNSLSVAPRTCTLKTKVQENGRHKTSKGVLKTYTGKSVKGMTKFIRNFNISVCTEM